jgi:putative restriction endonuclease
MATQGFEERVRTACFEAVRQRQTVHGEVLPVEVIREPFRVEDEIIAPFSLQRGIHKPRQLEAALCVTTTPPKRGIDAPYHDHFGTDGMFRYHYRDPGSATARSRAQAEADNEAVRRTMRRSLPLVYWYGVVPNRYRPFYPCTSWAIILRPGSSASTSPSSALAISMGSPPTLPPASTGRT